MKKQMKVNKKNVLPILLAVWPYIYLVSVLLTQDFLPFSIPVFALYFLLTAVLYIGNIIYVLTQKEEGILSTFGFILAIAHFPLQILGVFLTVSSLFIIFIPFFTLPAVVVIILVWGILYTDLLFCSVFGIKAVIASDLYPWQKILLILSQLFFVSNLVGAVCIHMIGKTVLE